MAGKIPAGEFNTRVSLDGEQPVKTLKQMRSEVSSLTASWRAQSAELKTAGDMVGSAKTKFEGLSNAVSKQKDYVARLKKEQDALDTSTNKGAEESAKLEKQISSATIKLSSLTTQQSKAKDSLKYYESGLASAQTELRSISETSRSYVTRLQAEGKQTAANKAEMSGLRGSYEKMSSIYKIQSEELAKIERESGKTSEAYSKQSVRVNQTATDMAKAKTRMSELDSEMRKANPSVFDKLRSHLKSVNSEADKTPGLFKKIVAGGVVSNAITSGWQALSGSIKSTVKSGLALNEAGEELGNTWKNMGKSSNDIGIMGDQLGYLRSQTGATGIEINTLQKTVDTFTGGVTEKTVVISAGLAGIATASHIGGEGMDGLSKSLARVLASGNLTTSGLAKLEKLAPTLGEQLSKAAGVSQTAFNDMVAKGKINANDLKDLLYKIGTTSSKTFDEYGKTSKGAMAQIQGGWTTLKANMTKPLLDVKNSGMTNLASLVNSPVLQKAATSLGVGVANIAAKGEAFLAYIAKHKSDVTGIAGDIFKIGKIAGEEVWSIFKDVIKEAAGWLGVGGKNAKTMKDPLEAIHDVLDAIVKNKSGIETTTKVVMSLFAIKKALGFASALSHVTGGLEKLGSSKIVGGILNLNKSLVNGSKLGGVGQSIKSAGGLKGLSTAGKVSTGLAGAGVALDAGIDIYSAIKEKNPTKKFEDFGSGAGKAIGGGLGLFFGGPLGAAVGAKIGGVIGKWGGLGTKKFMDGWNKAGSKKKPDDWLEGIGWNAHKMSTKIGKWWNDNQKANEKAQKKQQKAQDKANKAAQKKWNSYWSNVSKGWTKFWGNVGKNDDKSVAKRKKAQEKVNKTLQKNWNSYWSNVGKGWNKHWSSVGKANDKAFAKRKRDQAATNKAISKSMSAWWSGIQKNWNSFWSSVGKKGSSGMNSLHSTITRRNNQIGKSWREMWSGLASWFGGIWSGIKKHAKSGMNGVIDIINGAIGGINFVWEKFTGKNAIKKLQRLSTGGVVGSMQKVMLNDGVGSNWKELFVTPSGHAGMFKERNKISYLPRGTRVFNGDESKSIMSSIGIEHFANGGVIGDIGNFFKSGWDKLEMVGKWLSAPQKYVSSMINNAVNGAFADVQMFTDLGRGIGHQMIGGVADWFKKQLKGIEDKLQESSAGSGAAYSPSLIKKAAAQMHANPTDAYIKMLGQVIMSESGGKSVVQQIHDVNSGGNEARGILQYTPPTFGYYAVKGHKNIMSPFDQLLAFFNNSDWKNAIGWTTIWGKRKVDWLHSGPQGHRRFANGGFTNKPAIFGDQGLEAAIPMSALKSSRGYEMLGKTAAAMAARDNISDNSENNKELNNKLDDVILLMKQMIKGQNELLTALVEKNLTINTKTLNKVMAPEQSFTNRQRQVLAQRGIAIDTRI
ncbi:tape measure protein [Lapidilactobacillus wuchangensis]|uniref:tape measure protein n=1 Tax=Lapidilactobacillus wuchangensis TaxID=2486001 RepID=UPI000F7B1ED2|nr:tape measure protein [Lapidilactobacillus wuchangensis]